MCVAEPTLLVAWGGLSVLMHLLGAASRAPVTHRFAGIENLCVLSGCELPIENPGGFGIWGLGGLAAHFDCKLKNRLARKLRRSILLHFGLITFRIHFWESRQPLIFMVFGPGGHDHGSHKPIISNLVCFSCALRCVFLFAWCLIFVYVALDVLVPFAICSL